MSIATSIADRGLLSWKALLVLTLLGVAAVSVESCAKRELEESTVVSKDIVCKATSIDTDGKVSITCDGTRDSFVDNEMAIALLKRPQPLKCTLYRAGDNASCTLISSKK